MHKFKSHRSEGANVDCDVALMPHASDPSHHRPKTLSNGLSIRRDAQRAFPVDPLHSSDAVGQRGAGTFRNVARPRPIYSVDEKRRRDETPWTLVQGVLAPVQFAAFLASLALVTRYLATGDGLLIATWSIVIKTMLLYAIMITGSIWEHKVFGRYLFAPAFFWEDVVSMLVLALHTAYLAAIIGNVGSPRQQMILVLAAYATYAINAAQFLLKLRAARLQHSDQGRSGVTLTEAAA